MTRLIAMLALVLSACAAPLPQPQPITEGEAIRIADGATATRIIWTATAAQQGTESAAIVTQAAGTAAAIVTQAAGTATAISAQATSTMLALAVVGTQGAMTATMGAPLTQSAATTIAATPTARAIETQTMRDEREAGQRAIESEHWGEMGRTVVSALTTAIVVIVIVFVVAALFGVREFVTLRKQQSQERHEAAMLRARFQAMVEAIRETNAGTLIINPDGNISFHPPMLRGPVEESQLISNAPAAPSVIDAWSPNPLVKQARDDMIEWINLSTRWHSQHGGSGETAHQLKRWNHIGKDSDWQKRVRGYFGGALISDGDTPGTYARGGLTLAQLRSAVMSGRIAPCVARRGSTHTAQHTEARAIEALP